MIFNIIILWNPEDGEIKMMGKTLDFKPISVICVSFYSHWGEKTLQTEKFDKRTILRYS